MRMRNRKSPTNGDSSFLIIVLTMAVIVTMLAIYKLSRDRPARPVESTPSKGPIILPSVDIKPRVAPRLEFR